jgi:hypothetical protein
MTFANFTYTDAKQKTTQRKVLVVSMPSNKLTGIDVGELDAAEQARFVLEYGRLEDMFRQSVLELQADFDLRHNFRQFLEAKVENLQLTQE